MASVTVKRTLATVESTPSVMLNRTVLVVPPAVSGGVQRNSPADTTAPTGPSTNVIVKF